ncbi:MAG: beta-galactosidase, partial [Atopostipes sp.]|nr:beta-galactosidase [Atopostipes sp.]
MKFDKLLHGGDYFPEQWLNYPGIIEEDIKLLKESKSNAVSIGMFAWTTYEPEEEVYNFDWLDEVMDKMAENGIQVMLATPSGARPDWMSKKYPEVLRTTARREQLLHGERHNHCLSSPYYRKKVKDINRKLANRYKNHPALSMWHVSNEYSGECHCDLCQAAFRNWLKNKYHNDLDELNHAWWTSFWSHKYTSWNQIESPSPIGEMHTHGLNLDWKRFITDQTLDFYRTEIDPLKKITPEIPVFTNFQADNSDFAPFTGLNYAKFVEDIDLVAWNAYPKWHNDTEETYETASKVALVNDYYKTLKQQPFILTESTPSKVNWHNVNKAKRPGMHILSSMQMIAHGSNSNLYFQVRKSRGSSEKFHGAIINHGPSEKDRVFQEVKKVGDIMHQISSEIIGSNRYADVGILYDVENSWALNDAQGYGMNTKDYAQTVSNHYQALWKKDIPVDLLSPKDDFDSYKLLILPMLYMMDQKMLDKIEKFVKEGGSIVLTYISGVVNQNDLVYMDGWPKELQRVFGLDVLEVDTLYPKDRNQVLY